MKLLDKRTSGDLLKLVIFIVVTTMATGVLVVLIGNLSFQSSRNYSAVFTDATGVVKGDDVRVAGVKVGSVKKVEVRDRTQALVKFSVFNSTTVTKSAHVQIRYRNLVGQRYLDVTQGVGDTSRLAADATIPDSRTSPALDLTVLFNGFKPLFAALSPTDINKLSYELIQVFQGESGNLQGLLQSTSSVTQTLANRDQLIGDVITNLNAVLTTLHGRDDELSNVIVQLRSLTHGLTGDRQAILGSLDSISLLTGQTANLVTGLRPSFVADVKGLRRLTANLKVGRPDIDKALQILPIKLTKIGRTATYGSFFNFYLCQLAGRVKLPIGNISIPITVPPPGGPVTLGGRCNLS